MKYLLVFVSQQEGHWLTFNTLEEAQKVRETVKAERVLLLNAKGEFID